MGSEWVAVGDACALARGGRLQARVAGRFVTVLRLRHAASGEQRLTCLDAVCFHAGGPLGLGDIEDIGGSQCLSCPWHHYKVDAFTGEKLYQPVSWQDGRMVAGPWKSSGRRQRIHEVEQRPDGRIYVRLNSEPAEMASDAYACETACGARLVGSPGGASARQAAAAGADGCMPPPLAAPK